MLGRLQTFARFALGLAALGPDPAARARILFAACWLLARSYVPALPRRPARLRVRRHGREVAFWVAEYPDLEVVRELYLEDEYDEALPASALPAAPATVFDCGANIGLAALDFRTRWPDAVIHAFEPDPHAFATLARNVADDPGIHAHNVAIGAADGERVLFSSPMSVVSSFHRQTGDQAPVPVAVRSLDSLMAELGVGRVDLLKLDVEGAEAEALRGLGDPVRVGAIVGELHFEQIGGTADGFVAAHLPGFSVTVTDADGSRCTFRAVRGAPR